MKTKKSEKKMKLNKITVTNLSNREMHRVAGGVTECTQFTLLNCDLSDNVCTQIPAPEGTWVDSPPSQPG